MSDKLRRDPKRSYPYLERYGALRKLPEAPMTREE